MGNIGLLAFDVKVNFFFGKNNLETDLIIISLKTVYKMYFDNLNNPLKSCKLLQTQCLQDQEVKTCVQGDKTLSQLQTRGPTNWRRCTWLSGLAQVLPSSHPNTEVCSVALHKGRMPCVRVERSAGNPQNNVRRNVCVSIRKSAK